MSTYYNINTNKTETDFSYNRIGTYLRPSPSLHPYNKKMIKRSTTYNKVCPSCGLVRSANNKCECNEE